MSNLPLTSPQILIATTSFGEWDKSPLDILRGAGCDLLVRPRDLTGREEDIMRLGKDCVGIIAGTELYSAATLDCFSRLQTISRCGAGLDTIDLVHAEAKGISVLSTPFGPTQAAAELTLGLIMSLIRHIPRTDREIREGQWRKRMGFLVGELTFGILGLGRIGKRLAEMLRCLGARVVGYDKQPDLAWCQSQGVDFLPWDQVIHSADVLSLHLPHDPDLHHCLGPKELACLRPGSFVVNTSRGGLVDEGALAEALRGGHLSGAALDVFEREPYQGPLRDLPNILLTSHIGSYARAGRIAMEREAAQNLVNELRRLNVLPPASAGTPGRIP